MNPYQDQIGQRLDHPEDVPAHLKHLVPDDQQRVEKILSIPVSGRVLDVGCSDGAITRRIAERWPVFAIGADLRVDDTTDDRVCWDCREPYHLGDIFDAIYACEVFEHLTDADADKALTNILQVLKPGGDLIITVPNRYPAEEYEAACRDRWRWPDHRSVWRWQKLSVFVGRHFQSHGFMPLYEGESFTQSIWLICHAKGKK